MSRSDEVLPEHEIRALLLDDPPGKLSSAQRARLRARLGLVEEPDAARAASLGSVAAPDDISVSPSQRPGAPSRKPPAWLAAAAALLVAGLFVLLLGNQREDSGNIQVADAEATVSSTPAPSPEPPAERVCREHVGRFTAAIETWDGVENWAFLTDKRLPEPDLVELALDATSAIAGIATFESASETQRMLSELRADVVTGTRAEDPFNWSAPQRDAHRAAVDRALAEIEAVIAREGWAVYEGCG